MPAPSNRAPDSPMSYSTDSSDGESSFPHAQDWGNLRLASYVQSLAKEVARHNQDHSIYPGEDKDKLDENVLRRLRACSAIAVLADTGTGWETATAVSISVYGASRAAGFEETSLDGLGPAVQTDRQKLLQLRAREERQRGVQRVNVEVRVAQARDVVPANEVTMLTNLLRAVDRWHALGVVSTEGK